MHSKVYDCLNADYQRICAIRKPYFACDAYFKAPYNFVFEYDTLFDFCTHKENVLKLYPANLNTNFSIEKWRNYCKTYKKQADKFQKFQKVNGFNTINAKSAKRTLINVIKDSHPKIENMKPTLRFCEFEVKSLNADNKLDKMNYKIIEELLKEKLT